MNIKKRLNLFWLGEKGLVRFKSLFLLKLVIIILWGLMLINLFLLIDLKILSIKNNIYIWLLSYQFALINLLTILFILTITMLTFRLRKDEFGLYRCSGGTRKEIILLVLCESLILSLISIIIILAIEIFFLLYFQDPLVKLFKLKLNFPFAMEFLKGFLLTFTTVLLGVSICYLPFGVYYAFKDPYNIVKY